MCHIWAIGNAHVLTPTFIQYSTPTSRNMDIPSTLIEHGTTNKGKKDVGETCNISWIYTYVYMIYNVNCYLKIYLQ
jgi:hypothetical protein